VVGFDDVPSSAFYNPPLTTVHQLLDVQGSLGAELMREVIREPVEKHALLPRHRKVSPRLVIRESTCPATRSEL
jgi:DNA-binding LacI/PurR family transcriptional regulator